MIILYTVTKILGIQGDGDIVQIARSAIRGNVIYEKMVIWAEEAASLSNNQLEWSFGNNATGQIGIPLPEDW